MNMRICIFPVLASILVSTIGFSQESEDWYDIDRTKKLQDVIKDFRLNYELVRNHRHAFVCDGTRTEIGDEGVRVKDVYYLGLLDSSKTRFFANSWIDELSSSTARERWDQKLFSQGKLYRRWGPFDGDVRNTLVDEDEIKEARKTFIRFNPIDMSLAPEGAAYVMGPEEQSDKWLTAGTLISSEFTEEGDIVHITEIVSGDRSTHMIVRWSKAVWYYPTRVEYASVTRNDQTLHKTPLSLVVTDWKKQGEFVVPVSLSLAGLRKTARRKEMWLNVEYKFDLELPPRPIVEPDMLDWREPLRIAFDKDWQRSIKLHPLLNNRD